MRTWGTCIGVAVLGVLLGWFTANAFRRETTTSLLSPDEGLRAVLVESSPRFIDRNFRVYLESTDSHTLREIFRSPDEGMPIGSERFLWSRDGKRLLLLGRHFFVEKGAQLPNGELLYLMYDIPSGRIWCNAKQSGRGRFGSDELAGCDFGEPLLLKRAY
jgi:hypothetical protein